MKTNHTYKTYLVNGIKQLTVKDINAIAKKSGLKFNSVYKVLNATTAQVKTIKVR